MTSRGGSATRKHSATVAVAPRQAVRSPVRERIARVRATLEREEAPIRGKLRETGISVSRVTGERLWSKQGTIGQVPVEAADLPYIRGQVFTHNHPTDSGFSLNDYKFAAQQDLAEMRAATRHYTYVMRPPSSGWPEYETFAHAVERAYNAADRKAAREMRAAKLSGRLTPHEAEDERYHLIAQRVAAKLGFHYKRMPYHSP